MEGTLGAADLGLLRGSSGEAALGPGSVGFVRRARLGQTRASCASGWRGSGRATGLAKAGRRRLRRPSSSCLLTRVGLRGGIAGHASSGFGWVVFGVGFSFRHRGGLVTRGARADRVGAKLRCLPQADGARCRAARAGRPLARETSAGTGRSRRERTERLAAARTSRCHPGLTVGVADGASTLFGGFSKSSASWMRRVERRCWGSGDHTVVLAGCSGCRARRAASGPGFICGEPQACQGCAWV